MIFVNLEKKLQNYPWRRTLLAVYLQVRKKTSTKISSYKNLIQEKYIIPTVENKRHNSHHHNTRGY